MRTIKFQIIIRNEIDGYERLTEKDGKIYWEWMSYVTNPEGREYWNKGVYPYGHKYIRRQFTGLHDKNGKEIYEGDFLISPFTGGPAPVIYDQEYCQFTFGGAEFNVEVKHKKLEVIGNIYENPELL